MTLSFNKVAILQRSWPAASCEIRTRHLDVTEQAHLNQWIARPPDDTFISKHSIGDAGYHVRPDSAAG